MYDSEIHQQTRAVLVCLSRVNCYKPTCDSLVYPGPHARVICCFTVRETVLAEINLEIEPAGSIVASSTLEASRGGIAGQ